MEDEIITGGDQTQADDNAEYVETETDEVTDADNSADEIFKEFQTLRGKNKHYKEKLNRVEKELEELKNQATTKTEKTEPQTLQTKTSLDSLAVEETVLRTTREYDDDDFDQLRDVAKVKGISLLKAEKSPLFQYYLKDKEEIRKKEEAQIKSSRATGLTKKQDKPSTYEERKAIRAERRKEYIT